MMKAGTNESIDVHEAAALGVLNVAYRSRRCLVEIRA